MKNLENKTIVVPFDFSEMSKQAVIEVLEWVADSTTVYVIYVVEPVPMMVAIDVPIPPMEDRQLERAQQQLRDEFSDEKYARLEIECKIGDPGSQIVEFARNVNADLIAMPSHGYSGIKRILLGSVAERVLRLADRPVLILR